MRRLWWIVPIVAVWAIANTADDISEKTRGPTSPSAQTFQTNPATETNLSGPQVNTDRATYEYVTGDRVRLRSGPTTSDSVLGHLNTGDRVRLLGRSGSWSEVITSFGRGWMSSDYLSPDQPPTTVRAPATPSRQIAAPTDREIRDARAQIIRQSIASYQGSCPCPYNIDRAGHRCGGRSAWSRPGGFSPICYDSDVTDARLQSYLARQR
ncbi:SH3 domain-containing protein [Pelagovum pacificum]|uniref:SH3b domain-containing protein n=1 Tax=Pelagovum pacificum TaxID=2588711 RepID=A0A5C5G8B1_9RHOB|nr:SH3 domain-containing protein [Pelagovum pacificum]TNY30791.1 hypothetical protein FHY64_16875 [Pelagovum pacificum]